VHKEEAHTGLGLIKIHKNVVASIASLAAMEVDGVKQIGKDLRSGLLELIDRKTATSIRVEFDKNEEVKIEIPLVIKYGFNIPEIASQVQENVRLALEKMTNLSIKDIDINIQGIERG
jgi:uncharacterized alkaline shock family protein YloU